MNKPHVIREIIGDMVRWGVIEPSDEDLKRINEDNEFAKEFFTDLFKAGVIYHEYTIDPPYNSYMVTESLLAELL